LPVLLPRDADDRSFRSEREILYQILFDMKRDVNDLKKLVNSLMDQRDGGQRIDPEDQSVLNRLFEEQDVRIDPTATAPVMTKRMDDLEIEDTEEIIEESLSLQDKEIELINKSLRKHAGKRKLAAQELGISERTLYRKIKEFGIEE
jgi:transcriptional regulator with PAS, ATPase and Fis domain